MTAAAPAASLGGGRVGALASRLPRPRSLPQVGLLVVVVFYATAFSWWTVRNHEGYGTFGFDLGIYDQGLWLLSRFHAPFVTIMGRNLFGDHTSFILLPLVPVYWVFPSVTVLLVAQSVALALTAVPVFLVAKRRLEDEWLALVLAAAVLLQPALQWTNVEQFHPDAFEVPLVALVLLFMLEQRWTPYFVSVALLLSVKEDTALLLVLVGAYVAVRYNRKIGLLTCAISIGYALLAVLVILRLLNGVGSLNGWRIPFGGPGGTIRTLFAHPAEFWNYVVSDQRPWYLWQLFAPLALVPLLAPDVVALATGAIASNVISTFFYQHRIQYHYSTLIVAVLAVAAIVGISRLRGDFLRYLTVGTIAATSLWAAWAWGPAPWARHPSGYADPSYPSVSVIDRAIATIPTDATVSAWYGYITHLEHRQQAYEFPVPWHAQYWGTFDHEGERLPIADDVDYIVVPAQLPADQQQVLDSIRNEFRTTFDSPYVVVLQRR